MSADEVFDADEWLASFWQEYAHEARPVYESGHRRRNPVVEETFDVASRVMDYCERLLPVNSTFTDQILRSGTAVGSHTREAQGAESLADFVHKMKIGFKELEETDYRLALCHIKAHYPHDDDLVRRTRALFPLFNSILKTSKERLVREGDARRRKPRNGPSNDQ